MMERIYTERAAPVLREACVSSTNTLLKQLSLQGAEHGTVLTAHTQTGGRGLLGRSFVSPSGGLYLSMLLCPDCAAEDILTLTPCTAVAVCRAIEKVCGISPGIKWPNDLIYGGKKICGILSESVYGAALKVILGIGINVNTPSEAFPDELRDIASSVFALTGKETDTDGLCRAVIDELDSMYHSWSRNHRYCIEEYRRRCINTGRDVLIIRNGASTPAKALFITDDFALRVRYADGAAEDIAWGEVSVRSASLSEEAENG